MAEAAEPGASQKTLENVVQLLEEANRGTDLQIEQTAPIATLVDQGENQTTQVVEQTAPRVAT